MATKNIVLAGGARTAIGGFMGAFSQTPAPVLGAEVVKAALSRAGVSPDQVDEVFIGNVIAAGLGQNLARQVTIGAGLKPSVGSMTVNKLCGSGMMTVIMAAQAIRCGDANLVVAGGVENMTRAPYLLEKARTGYKMGHGELLDSLLRDGLFDAFTGLHMGVFGDKGAEVCGFSREDQDIYAIESYRRAIEAMDKGLNKSEIVPIEVRNGKSTTMVTEDEEPRRFDESKFRALKPAFGKEGTVTAGNASSVDDGAAAIVVTSEEKAKALGIEAQGRILGYATVSREPEMFTLAPVMAIQKVLARVGLSAKDIDIWEINEAFSVVPMAAMKDLGIERCRINVFGGAVALGHPVGASGTRVLVTLLNALKQRDKRIGLATLCIGGGEGVAMVVERI